MIFDRLHPSMSKLRTWFETGEPERVGAHVERCEQCADRLEQFDRDDAGVDAARSNRWSDAMRSLFDAPSDLDDRVIRNLEYRSRTEHEFALVAGLFAVGVDTARLIAAHPADVADDPSATQERKDDHEPLD